MEDRILPVLREVAVQPNNKRANDAKRGSTKHTFSFGHGAVEE